MDYVECVVVGAGIVGLAIGRALAKTGRQVLFLEAEDVLGRGTSGRGSGVIHAGLYYPQGSLKARLCVAGRDALYDFVVGHGVPHRRTEKLVVATSKSEEDTLDQIARQATSNGAYVEPMSGRQATEIEPALVCTAALLSPKTGIVDLPSLLRAVLDDAEEFGAVSAFRAPLEAAHPCRQGFDLEIGGAAPMRLGCRYLVNAAGHGAPAVARSIEGLDGSHIPKGYFAKGNYFVLDGAAPFSRLIYPVPVPGGVGTHLTVDIAGTARFGPDVEWIETLDYAIDPARAESFYADIRRWWPALPDGALKPGHAGVRPKISARGDPSRDFLIEGGRAHGIPGLVNLFGIESPGLTAALAIGDHVHDLVLHDNGPPR